MQLGFFKLKTSWVDFKGKSAVVSKNGLRIGLLVVILKPPIRIEFSYLFDSLFIMVSRLIVKLGEFHFCVLLYL